MYAKLFSRITESSLMEEDIPTRYVFVMLLAIADPQGYVVGTDVAIARRLNMPLAALLVAFERLMAPDADSGSPELDGRRIVPSDAERGYRIVNFVTYRDIKDPTERREYMRKYMANYRNPKSVNTVNKSKTVLTDLTHADADADADAKTEKKAQSPKINKPRSVPERIAAENQLKILKSRLSELEADTSEQWQRDASPELVTEKQQLRSDIIDLENSLLP